VEKGWATRRAWLLGGFGENKGLLSFIILLQLAMFLFVTYSCAIELEYSFHVIILTYELAYSLCVMIFNMSIWHDLTIWTSP
jgi:hypothetical protein